MSAEGASGRPGAAASYPRRRRPRPFRLRPAWRRSGSAAASFPITVESSARLRRDLAVARAAKSSERRRAAFAELRQYPIVTQRRPDHGDPRAEGICALRDCPCSPWQMQGSVASPVSTERRPPCRRSVASGVAGSAGLRAGGQWPVSTERRPPCRRPVPGGQQSGALAVGFSGRGERRLARRAGAAVAPPERARREQCGAAV